MTRPQSGRLCHAFILAQAGIQFFEQSPPYGGLCCF
jgi:hypothetical protein